MLLTCKVSHMTDGGRRAADAAAEAFAVVGLYGDPTVPWSIALEAELAAPIAPSLLQRRLTELVAANPNCGLPPQWRVAAAGGWQHELHELMNTPYTTAGPIIRGACDETGRRVVVGGHHGAIDGLGMLALLSAVLDTDLRSRARGVSASAPAQSFAASVRDRLLEVAFRPPRRFRPEGGDGRSVGDWIVSAGVDGRVDTTLMVCALARLVEQWDSGYQTRRPTIVAIGASRREAGIRLTPDRDTTFLRITAPSGDVDDTRRVLSAATPQPDFPASRGGGLAPMATRVLASRLGSTALVSSLGVVAGGESVVRSLRLYPAPSGRSGVAVGAVNSGGVGTITVRARRRDFGPGQTDRMLQQYLSALRGLQPPTP